MHEIIAEATDDVIEFWNNIRSSILIFSGIFCADAGIEAVVTSSSNQLAIQFTSDESIGDRGFRIRWEAIPIITLSDSSGLCARVLLFLILLVESS